MIAVEEHTEREWQRHMMMEIWCLVADDYASALDRLGLPGKADEVRELRSGAYREISKAHISRILSALLSGGLPKRHLADKVHLFFKNYPELFHQRSFDSTLALLAHVV